MREVLHSALVARPPRRVYTLINDIESYPKFIPWCTHSRVVSRDEHEIIATIGVRRGPLTGEFTTRNELEPDRRILMHLVEGPFRTLEGEWLLTPIELDVTPRSLAGERSTAGGAPAASEAEGSSGCRVQLSMRFAFRNPLTALLFEQKFAETVTSLVDSFVARARTLP